MPDEPDSASPLNERCLVELTELAADFLCPVSFEPLKIKEAERRFQGKAREVYELFSAEAKEALPFEGFLPTIRKMCRQRLNKELGNFGKSLKGNRG